jgi:hypothetical protein
MGSSNALLITALVERCKCKIEPPCIHKIASTGDLNALEDFILREGEGLALDRAISSIDENRRTVLHCAVEYPGNAKSNYLLNG